MQHSFYLSFLSLRSLTVSAALFISSAPQRALFRAHGTSLHGTTARNGSYIYHLQNQHPIESPSKKLNSLAHSCDLLSIEDFDMYGDFHPDKAETSHIRRFESEIAQEFGKEDAVFMPSGVMAQSIALMIHSSSSLKMKRDQLAQKRSQDRTMFACHHTSHLILHEEEAYNYLLQMDPLVISTEHDKKNKGLDHNNMRSEPMTFKDIKAVFETHKQMHNFQKNQTLAQGSETCAALTTLILELPHRELGGKMTPLNDIELISKLCKKEGVKFHCDGARIFEAFAGYSRKQSTSNFSISDLSKPFDSIYISFYKGIGAISGAMLLGSSEFCAEARIWLRRFGGNLYTLLPYYVSSWAGYRHQITSRKSNRSLDDEDNCEKGKKLKLMTFEEKTEKMIQIVNKLSKDPETSQIMTFDPLIPETNMVHVYLKRQCPSSLGSLQIFERVRDKVESKYGINVFQRIREIESSSHEEAIGYAAKFEWTIGDANGSISDLIFLKGWKHFCQELKSFEHP